MAKVLGKNADFAITDTSISADVAKPTSATDALYAYTESTFDRVETLSNEITLNIESRTEDSTPYGTDFDEFDVLTYQWNYDINAFYYDASGETEDNFVVGLLNLYKKRFLFSPAGKPGGDASATQPKYLGRVVIASANVNPVRSGISQIRSRLQGDGPLYRDVA